MNDYQRSGEGVNSAQTLGSERTPSAQRVRRGLPVVNGFGVTSPTSSAGTRVLLINPWQTYPSWLANEFQSYLPLGLAMLAAQLERSGVTVEILDCLVYDSVYRSGDKFRFGLHAREVAARVAEFKPHVIGITNPFSSFIEDALEVSRLVKSVDASILTVLGGIEASLPGRNVDLLANNASLDVLVKGEGELTLDALIRQYSHEKRAFVDLPSVAGIVFRSDSGVTQTANRQFLSSLDELPLPAYHLLDIERTYANRFYARYRGHSPGTRSLPIHTSRGCPYSCTFCSVHSQVGKAHRRHSPDYVVRHMQFAIEHYGVTHFHFEDDNLTLNPHHTRELLNAIRPLGITWDTPNGVRADTIDIELAKLMASSGARSVTIAVESGDQRVLDTIVNKRLALDDVVTGVRSLREADIPTVVFFIVGFPGETEADVRTTLRFAKQLAREYDTANLLFVATPLPGTPLNQECADKGYFLRELNNESLLSAIRLNQTPLVATPEFDKARLFQWTKEEFDQPGLHTTGLHIPILVSTAPRALVNYQRFIGSKSPFQPGRDYWHHPHNNPPAVAPKVA